MYFMKTKTDLVSSKYNFHIFDAFHLILKFYTCYGQVTAHKSAFYTAN